jgi:hypothetical protein
MDQSAYTSLRGGDRLRIIGVVSPDRTRLIAKFRGATGRRRPIESRRHQTVHLCDGGVLSGADVVCPRRFDGSPTGAHKGVDDIVDVDIVMGRSAVPVHHEGSAGDHRAAQNCDHPGRAMRILTWTVDVG